MADVLTEFYKSMWLYFDGEWSLVDSGNNSPWNSVAWSPDLNLFVAVGQAGGFKAMTSPDGIVWTPRSTPSAFWNSVTWSPDLNLFVAVGQAAGFNAMTSPDGIVWTPRLTPLTVWNSVTWSPDLNLFVAVGQTGAYLAMTSPDGITWTQRSPSNTVWNSVAWSPDLNLFVAVGQAGSFNLNAMTSHDGATWVDRSTPGDGWKSVVWVAESINLFVAVGDSGVMTSPDGITWTLRSAPIHSWLSIAWSSEFSTFVAVGQTGGAGVMTSPDGITWILRSAPDDYWRSIAWSPELKRFLIVSTSGSDNNVAYFSKSDFYYEIDGRLYRDKAPQDSAFPYCVFFMVDNDYSLDFTDETETFSLQFSIYYKGNSHVPVDNVLEKLKDLFDEAKLVVPGWRHIQFKREFTRQNNDLDRDPPIQGVIVQYEVILEKER